MGVVSAITSCDRPDLLRRNVLSQAMFSSEFIVFDDSEDSSMRPIAKSMTRYGVVRYAGVDERKRFSEQFGNCELVNWALSKDGYSLGASRNAMLLDTLGRKVFLSDDDIICRPAQASVPHGSAAFATRAEALAAVQFTNENPLAICESALARCRVAIFGYTGDSGCSGPHRIDGATTREVVTVGPSPRRMRLGYMMLGAAAIDNRTPLPPFFPHGRNSDGLWGMELRSRGIQTEMLPRTMEHDPAEVRPHTQRPVSQADKILRGKPHEMYKSLCSAWDSIVYDARELFANGIRISVAVGEN